MKNNNTNKKKIPTTVDEVPSSVSWQDIDDFEAAHYDPWAPGLFEISITMMNRLDYATVPDYVVFPDPETEKKKLEAKRKKREEEGG